MPHLSIEFGTTGTMTVVGSLTRDLDILDDFFASSFKSFFSPRLADPEDVWLTVDLPSSREYGMSSLGMLRPRIFAALMDFIVDVLGYDLKSTTAAQVGPDSLLAHSMTFHVAADPADVFTLGLAAKKEWFRSQPTMEQVQMEQQYLYDAPIPRIPMQQLQHNVDEDDDGPQSTMQLVFSCLDSNATDRSVDEHDDEPQSTVQLPFFGLDPNATNRKELSSSFMKAIQSVPEATIQALSFKVLEGKLLDGLTIEISGPESIMQGLMESGLIDSVEVLGCTATPQLASQFDNISSSDGWLGQ